LYCSISNVTNESTLLDLNILFNINCNALRFSPFLPISKPASSPCISITGPLFLLLFTVLIVAKASTSKKDNISFRYVIAVPDAAEESPSRVTFTVASVAPMPKRPDLPSDMISMDTSSLLTSSSIRAISIASSTVLPLIFMLFLI